MSSTETGLRHHAGTAKRLAVELQDLLVLIPYSGGVIRPDYLAQLDSKAEEIKSHAFAVRRLVHEYREATYVDVDGPQ